MSLSNLGIIKTNLLLSSGTELYDTPSCLVCGAVVGTVAAQVAGSNPPLASSHSQRCAFRATVSWPQV